MEEYDPEPAEQHRQGEDQGVRVPGEAPDRQVGHSGEGRQAEHVEGEGARQTAVQGEFGIGVPERGQEDGEGHQDQLGVPAAPYSGRRWRGKPGNELHICAI
ncbi:hypothetical protein GCM10020000_74260 [Streptomyces olivoverticillatus]